MRFIDSGRYLVIIAAATFMSAAKGQYFSAPVDVSLSTADPTAIHAVDIDGDGDKDVLTASAGDRKLALYRNNGLGEFDTQEIISLEVYGAEVILTADLDGDLDIDLITMAQFDGELF